MKLFNSNAKFLKVITHIGKVVAFCSSETSDGSGKYQIGYSVLNPSPENPNVDAAWKDFDFLRFPREIRLVARDVITIDFKDEEIPTADVPFDAVSDGRYIFLFRQSTNNTIYVNRYVHDPSNDRLINAWEVRYRRSRKVDIPLDRKDTFGSTDMNGRRFLEPVLELDFVTNVADGRFAVGIVPTELAGVSRWQIFAQDEKSGRLNSFSILRAANGLFDLSDTLDEELETVEPNRSFELTLASGGSLALKSGPALALYNEQEWLEDEYGQLTLQKRETRLMVAVAAGDQENIAIIDFGVGRDGFLAQVENELTIQPTEPIGTALRFTRSQGTSVVIPPMSDPTALTIEAWIYPREFSTDVDDLVVQSAADAAVPFALALRNGVPVFGYPGDAAIEADQPLGTRGWTHLAGVWDGKGATLYVNGQAYDEPTDPVSGKDAPASGYRIGGSQGFTGMLDEVRLWKAARTLPELLSTMCTTVSAATPGWDNLLGYWKMDEPDNDSRFTTVANSSSLGAAADGILSGACWVPTSAPAGASMVPVGWDDSGLTVATTLLPFATTSATPSLFNGPDSQVHVYYSDKSSQVAMAAHCSVIVARATYISPWSAPDPDDPDNSQDGIVSFIARQTGTLMNNPSVNPELVSIVTKSGDPKHYATVTLRSPTGYTEVWPTVPLTLEEFMQVLNGEAAQTSTDPVEVARDVLMYDYTKVKVTPAGGQLGPVPGPGVGSSLFLVLPDVLPDNGHPAYVASTRQSPLARGRAGTDPWWQAAPPESDIEVSLGEYFQVLSENVIADYTGPLILDRDLAVEAWLKPVSNPMDSSQTLFVFNKPGEAQYLVALDAKGFPFAADGEVVARADTAIDFDSEWTHLAASYRTDFGVQLGGAKYLTAGKDESLSSAEAVTIEGWARLDSLGTRQSLDAKWSTNRGQSWELAVDEEGKVRFSVNQSTATGPIVRTTISAGKLKVGTWHHIAGVYDVSYERQVAIMFDAGSYVMLPQPASIPTDGITVALWVKRTGDDNSGTQVLIQSTDPLSALPMSLMLYQGVPQFQVFVNGNEYTARAETVLRSEDWVHIAGSYNSVEGIQLVIDGVPVPSKTQSRADLSKHWPDGRRTQDPDAEEAYYTVGGLASLMSFSGAINELSVWNRGLPLDEIRQKIRHPLATTERGLIGYWRFNDLYGTTVMDLAGTANGVLVRGNFIRIDKGAFAHKVFIDGHMEAFERVVDPIVISQSDMTMGMTDFSQYLQGAIAETRLWKVGRMNWQIAYFADHPLEPNPEGLIALWTFSAGGGRVAFDAKGDNNALIRDGVIDLTDEAIEKMWIRTTFKAGWTFFLNGNQIMSTRIGMPPGGFGEPQAMIGVMRAAGALANFFTGEINQLRVWNGQRTGDQVRASMYTSLSGDEPALAAYWPMNDGSGNIIGDRCGGANGVWTGSNTEPPWQLSTVPVGIEAPQLRSVPGGIAIPQNKTSPCAAGAAAYGQLEIDARGAIAATLKLAYALVDEADSKLDLISGFKLGNLELQFIGQAQLAPTLIGYIEGSPPLPAENLKLYPGSPDSYVAAATLLVDDTEIRQLSYTANRDIGTDTTVSMRLGFNVEGETSAGIGVEQKVFSYTVLGGLSTEIDETLSNLAEALVSEESTITARKYLETRGLWVDNVYQIDNGVGQIFYPSNVGYALVRSGTADVFAMRLQGSNTIVSYTMRPNPDIPEDVNIIMFKIQDTYVKNGTLDGWIGFQPDSSYKFLTPGERGSYFQPLQAYALKQTIERERQQRKTWFDNFDSASLGRREKVGRPGSIDIAEDGRSLANALIGVDSKDSLSSAEWKARMARRNMVNTYVWTAEGGFYAEEEQFLAVREESTGGAYSMTAKAGVFLELSFNIGPSFSLDALFGSHITTQAMKADQESWQFMLNTDVMGERYIGLLELDDDEEIVYTDTPAPGKVKGYRFMTFYLAPSQSNFEAFKNVVDEDWLNGQGAYAGKYDPDALALRQALTNVNEVWRVLHRVTYVSRVPPTTENQGESLGENTRPPDEESIIGNLLLIDALPTDLSAPNPMAKVSVEADALLVQLEQNPVWGARLKAQQRDTKQDIMTYMRSYYRIPDPK